MPNFDIYCQRVDSTGAAKWATGGIGVCVYDEDQRDVMMIPDGSGGAVISWLDLRENQDISPIR